MSGFIKLHRQIKQNTLWRDPLASYLFIHLLLSASFETTKYQLRNGQEIILNPGELITGRNKLYSETGINPNQIYRILCRLQTAQQINIKTTTKYSVITIVKWAEYQMKETKPTAKRQQIAQQSDTVKEVKNIRNKELNHKPETMQPAVADETNKIFDIFYETINPAIRYQNKTYRNSAKELIAKVGLEKALNAAKYAVSIQNQNYAPTITNPYQLLNKYGELQGFYAKNINKSEVVKI